MRWRAPLIALLALGVSSSAAAWQPIHPSQPTWRPPVRYFLNQAGSADLGFATTEMEVIRGLGDWTLVSCTSLSNDYRGSTSAQPGVYEGTSTIGWIESGWPHSSAAIGVAGPRWGTHIIEADISMNGVNYTWITGPGTGGGTVNAYSIILHEGGHFYGLGHTNVPGSSMLPSYPGGIVPLGPDDEAGICSLYPGSGVDCTSTGCPSGQECVEGRCQAAMGDGSLCSPCSTSTDCGGGSDFCLTYPDGQFCGQACGSGSPCPSGSSCFTVSSGARQCVGVQGGNPTCAGFSSDCASDADCSAGERCNPSTRRCEALPTDRGPLGATCDANEDCNSGLCLNGTCSQSCNWLEPSSCPDGFYCDGDVAPSCDVGYCMAGSPGGSTFGQSCEEHTDCASLHCGDGRCSQPCSPDLAVGCPEGTGCQVGSLPCRGSCRAGGGLGDPCEDNDDCLSRLCARRGDRSFCTTLCDDAAGCPDRFDCTPVGDDLNVCEPDGPTLGDPCGEDECISGICATEGDRQFCTRICTDETPCPPGFDCVDADESTRVCRTAATMMETRDDGCGCRAAGEGSGGVGRLLAVIGVAVAFAWRRRRRAR